MAKAARKNENETAAANTGDIVEQKVVALAEQLGWFLGRVQAKADGWLDNDALRAQVGQIRDGAADLLEQVNRTATAAKKAVVKTASGVTADLRAARPAMKSAATPPKKKASRGPVDAPGKRHRKPPPQERLDKRMGEVQGKKAGQKAFKVGKSRGRG